MFIALLTISGLVKPQCKRVCSYHEKSKISDFDYKIFFTINLIIKYLSFVSINNEYFNQRHVCGVHYKVKMCMPNH